MAACTETSSAEVGSSHSTIDGFPANDRAIATRCFRPPESDAGRTSRWRGSSRTDRARSFISSSCLSLPRTPARSSSERRRIARTVWLGLSALSGFWNTIWSCLRASRSRLLFVTSL